MCPNDVRSTDRIRLKIADTVAWNNRSCHIMLYGSKTSGDSAEAANSRNNERSETFHRVISY